jgi:hypothetical protein
MNAPSTSPAAARTPQAPLDEPVPRSATDSGFPTTVSSPERARNSGDTPAAPEDQGDDSGNELLSGVRSKRTDVERYLRAVDSRRRRLATVTIVAAAVATLLTAPAALGGKPLADWLTETFALSSPSWRILCAIAAVCSLIAALATQLHASKNYEEHIRRAQEIRVTLRCWRLPSPSTISTNTRPPASTSKSSRAPRSSRRRGNPLWTGSPSPCGSEPYALRSSGGR